MKKWLPVNDRELLQINPNKEKLYFVSPLTEKEKESSNMYLSLAYLLFQVYVHPHTSLVTQITFSIINLDNSFLLLRPQSLFLFFSFFFFSVFVYSLSLSFPFSRSFYASNVDAVGGERKKDL